MKTCTVCALTLDESRFYRQRGRLRPACKSCFHITDTWKLRNPEKARAANRRMHQKRRASPESHARILVQRAAWRARSQPKIRAQRRVRRAIARGEIVRPALCECCTQARSLQAHHDDYAEPLAVIWLCQVCHKRRHAVLDDVGARLALAAYSNRSEESQ